MRLIDADALLDALDKSAIYGWSLQEDAAARRWAERVVELMPTAEPEIIRCKDCKNWDTTWQNDWAKNYHYCPIVDGTRDGDWYCADAERRTDGEC